jgi:hypothetical protein
MVHFATARARIELAQELGQVRTDKVSPDLRIQALWLARVAAHGTDKKSRSCRTGAEERAQDRRGAVFPQHVT